VAVTGMNPVTSALSRESAQAGRASLALRAANDCVAIAALRSAAQLFRRGLDGAIQ